MCAHYWNLTATLKCPTCKKTGEWELQTHFGDGMMNEYYKVGEVCPPLAGFTGAIDGTNDDFIGSCPFSHEHKRKYSYKRVGAIVEDGVVTRVWILKPQPKY